MRIPREVSQIHMSHGLPCASMENPWPGLHSTAALLHQTSVTGPKALPEAGGTLACTNPSTGSQVMPKLCSNALVAAAATSPS